MDWRLNTEDYESVYGDLLRAIKLLSPGGLILCDDVKHTGPKDALKKVNESLEKICIQNDEIVIDKYDFIRSKDIDDPDSMYAFIHKTDINLSLERDNSESNKSYLSSIRDW